MIQSHGLHSLKTKRTILKVFEHLLLEGLGHLLSVNRKARVTQLRTNM